jgi:hypothetical protein
MNHDQPLVPARDIADAATVSISLEDGFPEAAEILLILPFSACSRLNKGEAQAPSRFRKGMHHSL